MEYLNDSSDCRRKTNEGLRYIFSRKEKKVSTNTKELEYRDKCQAAMHIRCDDDNDLETLYEKDYGFNVPWASFPKGMSFCYEK
uniref:Uncharacterized protein n=1 Tax=Romanomermis culicivorax TaxID=13658 RepID=A0A915HQV8_ROMCU